MSVRNMFRSKAEKQYQQELRAQIKDLHDRFPENTYMPSSGPDPNKTSELRQEVHILRNALDRLEASRTSTIPRVPTVPNHIVELDASQTRVAGTIPFEPTIHVNANLNSTPNHITSLNPTQTQITSSSHLDVDIGLLGLKTLHLYIFGGFVLAYMLITKLSEIAIKTIEIISIVLTDSAIVRGLTLLGLGVAIAGFATVAHVNDSNNVRRVMEKGVEIQTHEQRQRQLEMKNWTMTGVAESNTQERVLRLENGNPGVAFPRLLTAGQRESVRA